MIKNSYIVLATLFSLILILAGLSIWFNSVTVDEFSDVPVGFSQLRTGKFNMDPVNPPLIRMWASIPLFFVSPRIYLDPGFENIDYVFYGRMFMLDNFNRYHYLISLSRIMIGLLIIPLLILVWKWTKKDFSVETGLFALFLLLLNPNILAHATLATLDFGLTVLFFAAVYMFKRFIEIPNWKYAVLFGIILGLAQVVKFTGLLLYPIYLFGVLLIPMKHPAFSWKKLISMAMIILLLSIVVINTVYFFQLSGMELRSFTFQSSLLKNIKSILPASLTMPLPFFYLTGIDRQLAETSGYDNYLNGTLSTHGWWYYYLFAFLIKNPLSFLACLLIGAFIYFSKTPLKQMDWMLIIPPLLIFLFFSLNTTKNIGLRFILPAYPFLAILAAQTIRIPQKPIVIGIISLWYLISVISITPNYLAYFNELVGGPSHGYHYLLDSNLDWGQDLIRFKKYLNNHHINRIPISSFGPVDPAIYGINMEPLSSQSTTGLVAISVNNLCGISLVDKNQFAWLRNYEPKDKSGYSIFIYDIPAKP